ncbi:hypothetical protein SY83_20870 [Paenibacillus swuensis]|uniref:DUF2188 domain-containing protein n=1 Tax=Paenibacillus swuensis TaxID=1178515 RepID=A0A172TND0_9BACL|nr:DUF2188 domain-containing protein [Paenibacillus swuensis]ANE48327.1 hypothetical protein SY83_20870 [Paenibacillus swuensis]
MPWMKGKFPESMKNLDPRVRNKAVEIANALLEDGSEEGRAIAIATAQAKKWNEDHPLHEISSHSQQNRTTANYHVIPHDGKWAVKSEGQSDVRYIADTKDEAVKKAQVLATDHNNSAIIHRRDGTIESSHNYS